MRRYAVDAAATEAAVEAMSAQIVRAAMEQVAGGRAPTAAEVERAELEMALAQRRARVRALIEMAVLVLLVAAVVLPQLLRAL